MIAYKLAVKDNNSYYPLIKYFPKAHPMYRGVAGKHFNPFHLNTRYISKSYSTRKDIVCAKGYHLFKKKVNMREVFDASIQKSLKNKNIVTLKCITSKKNVIAENNIKLRTRNFKIIGEI